MKTTAVGSSAWSRAISSAWTIVALLLLHVVLALAASRSKSNGFDELAHLTAGVSYWRTGDFRLQPENGNWSQRWIAIPAALGDATFPPTDGPEWSSSHVWDLGQRFLYELGNDVDALILGGRAMVALASAALALLSWWCARTILGPVAAAVALAAYALSPTTLAHGALMTSDMLATLFFHASIVAFVLVARRATALRVLASSAALGALFLAKMSAPLVLPVLLAIAAFVALRKRAWTVGRRELVGRGQRVLTLALVLAAHALIACLMIWASFGFRYRAFASATPGGDMLYESWTSLADRPSLATDLIGFARERELLPEAYLYGFAYVAKYSRERPSFLNGEFSTTGFATFFPWAFATKTELALFALLALGAAALLRSRGVRDPLLAGALALFAALYALVALSSDLNIGHRHLLPIYPTLFVLAGASGAWLLDRSRAWKVGVAAALLALVAECALAYPSYLAFFNAASGGSSNGWRRLVDSSLDWGQDLPALKRWLDARPPSGPRYLAYFGTASPTWHRIDATRLPGWFDKDLHGARELAPLVGGTYCLSATLVQGICTAAPGPWLPMYEQAYQDARAKARRYYASREDPAKLEPLLREMPEQAWKQAVAGFDNLRFARLMAVVRERQPVADVEGSILIFELDDATVARAIDGPPPYRQR